MKTYIAAIIGIILLGSIVFIGLKITTNNNQEKQIAINNQIVKNIITKGTEIKTYAKLVEAVKSENKFLIKYTGQNNLYIRNFNSGTLSDAKDIIFNGSQYWTSNDTIYNHSYKYDIMPNNQVKISGKDRYASDLNTFTPVSTNVIGLLGKSVIIYAYT